MTDQPADKPEQPAADQTPQERLVAAGAAFAQLNRSLPQGMPPFQPPPFLETAAGLDALASILLKKGIIEEHEFVDAKVTRMAEIVEELARQAAEVKRQALGLILAGPGRSN